MALPKAWKALKKVKTTFFCALFLKVALKKSKLL
jgi:hypothetical protein